MVMDQVKLLTGKRRWLAIVALQGKSRVATPLSPLSQVNAKLQVTVTNP